MIKVASYNMRKAIGTDRRRNPERILEVLCEIDADIIALQEADRRFGARAAVLSTHLIDEVADLLEHVVVVDHGQVLVDEDADDLRAGAVVISGPSAVVAEVVNGRRVLHCEQMAGLARVTVRTRAADDVRTQARAAGLNVEPLSLQQLVIRTTQAGGCPKPAGSELTPSARHDPAQHDQEVSR